MDSPADWGVGAAARTETGGVSGASDLACWERWHGRTTWWASQRISARSRAVGVAPHRRQQGRSVSTFVIDRREAAR